MSKVVKGVIFRNGIKYSNVSDYNEITKLNMCWFYSEIDGIKLQIQGRQLPVIYEIEEL